MPPFLEDLRVTEDGYLWMPSHPEQQECPPMLPHSENLWFALHPHCATFELESPLQQLP